MSPLVISIAAFVGVAALVGALAMMLRDSSDNKVEDRLNMLTSAGLSPAAKEAALRPSVLSHPLDDAPTFADKFMGSFGKMNLNLLFEQADVSLDATRFLLLSGALLVVGSVVAVVARAPVAVAPFAGMMMACLPLMWVYFRRARRFKLFSSQLPDALELIARALRAGHSLAAGFDLVHQEMQAPIGVEFGRVFEEQNLGIPIDEALESMTERIPNLDLKFFATAIILQRQTGGDLAEILDKIGHLIRERFRIWGQVQALTGEGRLSGIVLLALPPVLFLAVYRLNPGYVMLLFSDPLGKQMLAGAVIMQVLGALVIRKIVNIKV